MKQLLRYIKFLIDMGIRGVFKTLYLNFRLLPFGQAIRLPLYCTRHTDFYSLNGNVVFHCPVRHGLVKIGFLGDDMFVRANNITLLDINGEIHFGGKGDFAPGVSIIVGKGAKLTIGKEFFINGNVKIICHKCIEIGDWSRIAWESQLIDTNFHYVVDLSNGTYLDKASPISIGSNVWIGNRTTVAQGTIIPSYCIIASNSLCNKDYSHIPPDSIIGGMPAKLLKSGFRRIFSYDEETLITQKLGLESGR